jgi:colanic acid/amylovoran biosynthesis glycosyltransferase
MEMEKLKIQHVHAHFATHPAVAGLIIKRLTGIPYSFTVHGSDLHVERRMLCKKVEAASFAAAISLYNKGVMLRECGPDLFDKIHVVHCGVDTEFWRATRNALARQSFRIVCVASFEEVKGHAVLMEACKRLARRGVNFTCHLVGEGPLKQVIAKQIVDHDLGKEICLHGALPRTGVRELLAEADVFVLASVPTKEGKREGIPVVLMEAMSCGLPVVASDLSGIPELVLNRESGILVPPANVRDLAAALETLYKDPELRVKMGRTGRQRIVNEFSLERTALNLLELFEGNNQAPQ